MFDQLENVGKVGAGLAGMAYAFLQCVKLWEEIKRNRSNDQPEKGAIMRRIPIPTIAIAASVGLFAWAYASTSDPGSPGEQPCEDSGETLVIAMPPFHNESGREHMVPSGYDAPKEVDQYSTLSAKRFRDKLAKVIRRRADAPCFELEPIPKPVLCI